MRSINRDIVVGLVVSSDNQFLLGRKDPRSGGVYADCWHIPGGGIEDGETKQQALKREMLEELGLDMSTAKISLIDEKGESEAHKTLKDSGETVLCRMRFYVYQITINKKARDITVIPGDDIVEAEWVNLNTIDGYRLTPPSIELFARLGWMRGL